MDIYVIIALGAVGGAFYLLSPILMPFILGIIFAYLLAPSTQKIAKLVGSRTVATLIPLVIFMGSILLLLGTVIPFLAEDISAFLRKIPVYAAWLDSAMNEGGIIHQFAEAYSLPLQKDVIKGYIYSYSDQIALVALDTLQKAALGAMAIGNALSLIIITPLVTFYILYDWNKIKKAFLNVIPEDLQADTDSTLKKIDKALSSFLRGQLSVCVLLGLFYGVALGFSGLNMGFMVGLMTGILSFIPYIGMALGLIFASVLALMQYQLSGVEPYLIIAGIFIVGQLIESFFLTPRLVGGSTGLHPIWVIFAIMAGGQIGGFLGMLIALPAATVLTVLLPMAIETWYKNRSDYNKSRRKSS